MYNDPTGHFVGLASLMMNTSLSYTDMTLQQISMTMKTLGNAASFTLKNMTGLFGADKPTNAEINKTIKNLGSNLSDLLRNILIDPSLGGSYAATKCTSFVMNWILNVPFDEKVDTLYQIASSAIDKLNWLDTLYEEFISEFLVKFTGLDAAKGVLGTIGTVGSAIEALRDTNDTYIKVKAISLICNTGSAGTLFLQKFNAMANKKSSIAELIEFSTLAEMGMFDSIKEYKTDLIAAYLLISAM